jgi:hypothetical protein
MLALVASLLLVGGLVVLRATREATVDLDPGQPAVSGSRALRAVAAPAAAAPEPTRLAPEVEIADPAVERTASPRERDNAATPRHARSAPVTPAPRKEPPPAAPEGSLALEASLRRAMESKGLEPKDLADLEETAIAYGQWEAAKRARDATAAEKALGGLVASLERVQLGSAFLKKKLGRINQTLSARPGAIPQDKLQELEGRILNLMEASSQPGLGGAEAADLGRKIARLEHDLRAALSPGP